MYQAAVETGKKALTFLRHFDTFYPRKQVRFILNVLELPFALPIANNRHTSGYMYTEVHESILNIRLLPYLR